MRHDISRRSLLRYAAIGGLAAAAAPLITACGESSEAAATGTTSGGDLGQFTLQVNWTPDVTWAGSYMAMEAGLYQKNGFSKGLNFLAGGPNVAVEPIVESGKADMAVTTSETFAAAVAQGADLVAVGAFMQQNPYCITSLPAAAITTPKDMVGRKIGVSANNNTLFAAFLKANGMTESDVTKVVVQNDPTPLANGEVDGFLSYISNQPVTLELQGLQPVNMMISDFGFPLYEDIYIVKRDSLQTRRDALIAALKSDIAGWQMVKADEPKAVDLVVNKYAKVSNLAADQSALALKKDLALSQSAVTTARGLLYMAPEDIAKNVATLEGIGLGGLTTANYTTELLDQVYANGTQLI